MVGCLVGCSASWRQDLPLCGSILPLERLKVILHWLFGNLWVLCRGQHCNAPVPDDETQVQKVSMLGSPYHPEAGTPWKKLPQGHPVLFRTSCTVPLLLITPHSSWSWGDTSALRGGLGLKSGVQSSPAPAGDMPVTAPALHRTVPSLTRVHPAQ